jgi:hypothetical protein
MSGDPMRFTNGFVCFDFVGLVGAKLVVWLWRMSLAIVLLAMIFLGLD